MIDKHSFYDKLLIFYLFLARNYGRSKAAVINGQDLAQILGRSRRREKRSKSLRRKLQRWESEEKRKNTLVDIQETVDDPWLIDQGYSLKKQPGDNKVQLENKNKKKGIRKSTNG